MTDSNTPGKPEASSVSAATDTLPEVSATPLAETTAPVAAPEPVQPIATPSADDTFVPEDPPEPAAIPLAPGNYTTQLKARAIGPEDTSRETLFLPSMNADDYEKVESGTPIQAVGENSNIRSWMGQTRTARYLLPRAGIGQAVLAEGQWTPGLNWEGKTLKGARAQLLHQPGKSYTGEAARLRIRASAGLGTVYQQPLWHSGFWISVKAPQEGEYLELLQQLSDEKVMLANSTYGLLLANTSAYLSRRMFEFVEAHVYDHTLALAAEDNLGDFIRASDLALCILGMARVIWPDGFRISRACAAEPEKCVYTTSEVVTLDEFDPVNFNAFTDRQIKHMAQRGRGSMTKAQVKDYVDGFLAGQERTFELTSDCKITLKNPTINEHLIAGARWVDQIQQSFPSAMELDPDQRRGYLQEQSNATEMRQYAHYVHSIEASGATYSREEPTQVETLEEALDDFSTNDNLRARFTEEVIKFQEAGMVSMLAIPSYTCPNCGKDQIPLGKKRTRFPDLIALDAYRTFFTPLLQKAQKIRDRSTYMF